MTQVHSRTSKLISLFAPVVTVCLLAVTAQAGDPAAGKTKSTACVACHGENGLSNSGQWPNLAGQYADYLAHSLRQYRSGERKNAVMAGFASTLSDEDIEDLAAYYAAQTGLGTLPRTRN